MAKQEKKLDLSKVFQSLVEIANRGYSCSWDEGREVRVERRLLLGEVFWDDEVKPVDAAITYRKDSVDGGGTIQISPFGNSEIKVDLLITGKEFLMIVRFLCEEGFEELGGYLMGERHGERIQDRGISEDKKDR